MKKAIENKDKSFMVYEVIDSGSPFILNITRDEFIDAFVKMELDSSVLIILDRKLKKFFLWKGIEASARKDFICTKVLQDLIEDKIRKGELFPNYRVVIVEQGKEPPDFLLEFRPNPVRYILKKMKEKKKREGDDRNGYPYPYIFKPPSPPDDLGMSGEAQPKLQVLKEDIWEKPYCKNCGSLLSEGQSICHVCKKKVI
jgi:hypothetical protein